MASVFIAKNVKQEAKNFSLELFLEASDCENAFYLLPPLTRDSYSKKGFFTKIEKIIMQNYGHQFPFASPQKIKQSIQSTYNLVVDKMH